jgi:hypothetical protein
MRVWTQFGIGLKRMMHRMQFRCRTQCLHIYFQVVVGFSLEILNSLQSIIYRQILIFYHLLIMDSLLLILLLVIIERPVKLSNSILILVLKVRYKNSHMDLLLFNQLNLCIILILSRLNWNVLY